MSFYEIIIFELLDRMARVNGGNLRSFKTKDCSPTVYLDCMFNLSLKINVTDSLRISHVIIL